MTTDKLVDFDHVTDYISREAAWNGIYNCPTKTDADGYIWVRTKDVAHMIDDVPAADVVEVVRCKDCRYFYNGYDEKCCISHRGVVVTDENGFCHHAERRSDNDN